MDWVSIANTAREYSSRIQLVDWNTHSPAPLLLRALAGKRVSSHEVDLVFDGLRLSDSMCGHLWPGWVGGRTWLINCVRAGILPTPLHQQEQQNEKHTTTSHGQAGRCMDTTQGVHGHERLT